MSTGVIAMDYGTPRGPDDVAAFYTEVRRGRPPSPEQLADLERRYRAIGGVSPLAERTAAQVAALRRALEALGRGRFVVGHGTKHARPTIEQGVERLAAAGVERLVGLVLAPHYARLGVGEYLERAAAAALRLGLPAAFVEDWHDDEALVELLAERVLAARGTLPPELRAPELRAPGGVEHLFTAHSLPVRILAEGDPYPAQLEETARLVALRAGLAHHRVGWQSAGRTSEAWIGPDVLELLRCVAADGYGAVVVCPCGFTSDHLEVLYDLDIEARRVAEGLGLAFRRSASLNDEPRLFASLARRVAALAGVLPSR